MANPQLEDGRTEIANELVDVLARTYFSPAESKVLWAVFRKTYGYHKKTDRISYSQLEEITGLDRRHISRAIRRLISRNIISCNNAGERVVNEYGLQKDHELWNLTPISSTDNDENLLPESSTVDTNIINKSDTENVNSLLMKSSTDEKRNLTPISSTPDTTLGQSDTSLGVKSVDDIDNDKSNKAYYKSNRQKQVRAPAREDNAGKKSYGEFENVFLGDEDYQKLLSKFGQKLTDDIIEQLSGFMRQNPANAKKYKNHYATVRNWCLRDERKESGNGKNRQHLEEASGQRQYTPGPEYKD